MKINLDIYGIPPGRYCEGCRFFLEKKEKETLTKCFLLNKRISYYQPNNRYKEGVIVNKNNLKIKECNSRNTISYNENALKSLIISLGEYRKEMEFVLLFFSKYIKGGDELYNEIYRYIRYDEPIIWERYNDKTL